MKIVIINYGAGNIQSIQFALNRLGFEGVLSDDWNEIKTADKVIFPGVGQAFSAMEKLKKSKLDSLIPSLKQPVLGICLGMQLLCQETEEGNTKGLGIFDSKVVKFSDVVKVPQMGWNTIFNLQGDLFKDIPENAHMYLVHSYYAKKNSQTIATTNYESDYATAMQKDNFYGVQFHPEKSGKLGEQVLKNFLML
ncbi:MAG: glutamine amidotransferase [Flavobacterium sp.]|jgi:glutamine amidotransferase